MLQRVLMSGLIESMIGRTLKCSPDQLLQSALFSPLLPSFSMDSLAVNFIIIIERSYPIQCQSEDKCCLESKLP